MNPSIPSSKSDTSKLRDAHRATHDFSLSNRHSKKPRRKSRKSKSRFGMGYAILVGVFLVGIKIYLGQQSLGSSPALIADLERDGAPLTFAQSGSSQNLNLGKRSPGGLIGSSLGGSEQTPGDDLNSSDGKLLAAHCRSEEALNCTRKVFSPDVPEAQDGNVEATKSCVTSNGENICVNVKTIWNSTAQIFESPDNQKSDFELGGRFNHEEFHCSFHHPGSNSSGVTIRIEGKDLAETIGSIQRDCFARAEQDNSSPREVADQNYPTGIANEYSPSESIQGPNLTQGDPNSPAIEEQLPPDQNPKDEYAEAPVDPSAQYIDPPIGGPQIIRNPAQYRQEPSEASQIDSAPPIQNGNLINDQSI